MRGLVLYMVVLCWATIAGAGDNFGLGFPLDLNLNPFPKSAPFYTKESSIYEMHVGPPMPSAYGYVGPTDAPPPSIIATDISVGIESCAHSDPSGNLHVEVTVGCTIKNQIKVDKNTQTVTTQQTLPDVKNSKNPPTTVVQTIRTTTDGDKISSYSVADGESIDKAKQISTFQYSDNGKVKRKIQSVMENGKRENYVYYDKDFCKKLNGMNDSMANASACSSYLKTAVTIAEQTQNALGKMDMKLGVRDDAGKVSGIDLTHMRDMAGLMASCGQGASAVKVDPSGPGSPPSVTLPPPPEAPAQTAPEEGGPPTSDESKFRDK